MPYLAKKELCTGCTACANACPVNCIEMKRDEYGFAYPAVADPAACTDCRACEAVCPVQTDVGKNSGEPMAFAAYSKNHDLRMASSSGGVFSEIAETVIQKGGIVFGAAYDDCFNVYHTGACKPEELAALRGAKYAESWLGTVFGDIRKELDSGRLVLFSGTPCQAAGLKAFLEKDYDNLLVIDFVCHGIPSPMAWKKYVDYRAKLDNKGRLPTDINLRDNSTGWSRYRYSNRFEYDNGTEHKDLSSQSDFMRLFTQDYILRASCGNCRFKGYSRASDITLGDFWGVWDIAPEMDDDRGTSVILIQSEKGRACWERIAHRVRAAAVELEQASRQNPSMISSSKAKEERAAVLEKIRTEGFGAALLFVNKPVPLWKKARHKLKSFLRR